MAKSIAGETKTCSACGTIHPLKQFRRRSKTGTARQGVCNPCHALNERLRRASHRSQEIDRFAQRLKSARDAPRVTALCNGMIERFGGVDGFASEWTRQYNESPAGSRTHRDYLFGIVKLLEIASRRKR